MMGTVIESARGKTIAELEIIDLEGNVEIEIRFTDETCLHLNAKARAEVQVREFNHTLDTYQDYPVVVQDSF